MREMAGALDQLEARARNGGAIGAAIGRRDDAILRTPEKERRKADAMEAAFELWIVQIGSPAKARCRFTRPRDRVELFLRQLGEVALRPYLVEIELLLQLGIGDEIHIENIARLAIADLDAESVDENEMREARGILHCDLGRDPAADAGADDRDVAQIERLEQIEIEISEIVDVIELRRNLGATIARMRRCDDPRALRQAIE